MKKSNMLLKLSLIVYAAINIFKVHYLNRFGVIEANISFKLGSFSLPGILNYVAWLIAIFALGAFVNRKYKDFIFAREGTAHVQNEEASRLSLSIADKIIIAAAVLSFAAYQIAYFRALNV